ncbi:MAG: translation initiation factor IF-6 [Acidilobaceae archaeon]
MLRAKGRFEVTKFSINGNPNIGVYIHASDSYVLIPPGLSSKDINVLREALGVDRIVETTIFNMGIVGVLVAGNNYGVLLPKTVMEEEYERIKRGLRDLNVAVLDVKENALGNLIAANSRAALVYPHFDSRVERVIADTLGVEVHRMSVGGVNVAGSVLVVTDRGGVVCPEALDEEVKVLSSIFKVPVLQATVNFGVSFIRVGLIANSFGALAGEDTTGPELARIQMALGGEVGG